MVARTFSKPQPARHLEARARARALGVDVADVLSSNSIGAPDTVALRDMGAVDVAEGRYAFSPHSLTLLSFALA